MATCPHCTKKIPAHTITFALCPIWITCPECNTRLVGDGFIKAQGVLILPVTIAFALFVVRFLHSDMERLTVLLLGATIIVLVNVFLTVRFGKYERRNRDAQEEKRN